MHTGHIWDTEVVKKPAAGYHLRMNISDKIVYMRSVSLHHQFYHLNYRIVIKITAHSPSPYGAGHGIIN